MFDHIDPRSPTPIYAQIAARVRIAVASGELATGDPLPSVRALAGTLRVNPATVVQAYRELEHDGVIELRHGAGAFVSGQAARSKKAADSVRTAQPIVAAAIQRLRERGLTDEEIRRLFEAELAGLTKAGGRGV